MIPETESPPETPAEVPTGEGLASPPCSPILVQVPLRALEKARNLLREAKDPSVPFDKDNNVMLASAYDVRGKALERAEKIIGLAPDVGAEKCLELLDQI